jgi:hypothetical protein
MWRYLCHVTLGALSTTTILAIFNLILDPFSIYGSPVFKGFNNNKVLLHSNIRIYKTVGLLRENSDAVLIGTSRTDIGLSPWHQAFKGKRAVNLGMVQQPYEEARAIVEYLDPSKTRQVVFGIDFFPANKYLHSVDTKAFVPENYSRFRKLSLLVSQSTLNASYQTLNSKLIKAGEQWDERGQRIWDDSVTAAWGGNRKWSEGWEDAVIRRIYLPEPNCAFSFGDEGDKPTTPMAHLRALFRKAYINGLDLKLFIPPVHARQNEIIASLGIWQMWEEWKRKLVQMNEEEAVLANKTPFVIWDFSGYGEIQTEKMPDAGAEDIFMKNWFDSAHYSTRVGNLILDQIENFNANDQARNFGRPISSSNIDRHFALIRNERAGYANRHPNEVAEIQGLVAVSRSQMTCEPSESSRN